MNEGKASTARSIKAALCLALGVVMSNGTFACGDDGSSSSEVETSGGGGDASLTSGTIGAGASTSTTCVGDETRCAGSSSMDLCNEGQFENASCSDFCNTLGFAAGPCLDDFCQCGDPTDDACLAGVSAACYCSELGGTPCTDDDVLAYYVGCHTGDAEIAVPILCFGLYVEGGQIDCVEAASVCL
jgi:hypothetical protein